MNKLQQIVMQFLIIAIFIKAGKAIECYNCDSTNNPKCHDVKKQSEIKPEVCSVSKIGQNASLWLREITKIDFFNSGYEINVPMWCQKIVAKDEKGDRITFRGCQLETAKTNPCDIVLQKAAKMSNVKIEHCTVCSTDQCNASNQLQANLWKILIPISFFLYAASQVTL